jgi:hypothetical protein
VIDWALARGPVIEDLRNAILGNYQCILQLVGLLSDGQLDKRILDAIIDRCKRILSTLTIGDIMQNIREVILMHRGERDYENGEQVYKEMRFKSAPAKKTTQKEMSIIRNTLGHEDDDEES